MRFRAGFVGMRDQKSYIPPVKLGAIMRGSSVGQVVASKSKEFQVGDWVNCMIELGWCEYGVANGSAIQKITPLQNVPPRIYLGVLGGTGLTAYFGLLDIGKPKAGETVVVSAAAGATGSVVCQIAKHVIGCHVVGIAGGPEKCKWLVDELGVDAAVDYKKDDGKQFKKDLRKACPNGVDVFFDNVGGWILNDVLKSINFKARVVVCGAISGYNATSLAPGPSAYLNLITTSSRMEGFILFNYMDQYDKATSDLSRWLVEGKLKYNEDIVLGLDNAPKALLKLFGDYGGNRGRLLIDIHARSSSL
mmetsp:Transcript_15504/g.25381  ORF Transcript_15504/g.25381 Transcript_15504/m.25381 type:complete len:305 (+) Transcript_15504:701-1615(+)